MSKYAVMPLSEYVGACDAIREKTGATELIKSGELVKKIDDVFEAGKAQGGGGDSHYDTFWDTYQANGTRYHYNNAFGNQEWNDITYNPKYPFDNVRYANSMFLNARITDTKRSINFTGLSAQASGVFQSCSAIKTIRKLIVVENTTFNNWFNNCTALENIEVDGVIGQNLDIHWSTKLTAPSYNSIMTHLSTTATGKTLTLHAYATVKATYDAVYGEGAWDAIVAEKSNWTIAYS